MSEIGEKIDSAIAVAKKSLPSRPSADDIQKVAQALLNLAHVKAINDSSEPTEEMDDELGFVLGKIRSSLNGTELVQMSQAALNLMNSRSILTTQAKVKSKKPGASAS